MHFRDNDIKKHQIFYQLSSESNENCYCATNVNVCIKEILGSISQ